MKMSKTFAMGGNMRFLGCLYNIFLMTLFATSVAQEIPASSCPVDWAIAEKEGKVSLFIKTGQPGFLSGSQPKRLRCPESRFDRFFEAKNIDLHFKSGRNVHWHIPLPQNCGAIFGATWT